MMKTSLWTSALFATVGMLSLAACNDTSMGPVSGSAKVRYINSVYQTTDGASTTSTAVPRAIDVLFDGSTASPGTTGLAANTTSTGPITGGYRELPSGVRSFAAKLSAPATPNTSLFTNGAAVNAEFFPKLYFTGDTYYTIIFAGVAPTTGLPAATAFLVTGFGLPNFPIIDNVDRPPFSNGQLQARFRLVNAAPFSTAGVVGGANLAIFFTAGAVPPTAAQLGTMAVIGTSYPNTTNVAPFRGQSAYQNATAGQYVITVTPTTVTAGTRTVLAQTTVTLPAGEIRTFVIQNSAYAAVGSPANFLLTSIVDAQY